MGWYTDTGSALPGTLQVHPIPPGWLEESDGLRSLFACACWGAECTATTHSNTASRCLQACKHLLGQALGQANNAAGNRGGRRGMIHMDAVYVDLGNS
jgi:hypothetical protein